MKFDEKRQQNPKQMKPIYYLMDFGLYNQSDVDLFCGYKRFIQDTIVELGDDWRIQSGLLSQEIVTLVKSQEETEGDGSLEFNIFNQFLLPFLKNKIGKENTLANSTESEIQDIYTKMLQQHFNKNPKIIDSLTFKTLSLGFCITAFDQWNQSFEKLKDQSASVELIPLGLLTHRERQAPQKNQPDQAEKKKTPKNKTQLFSYQSSHNSSDGQKNSDRCSHNWQSISSLSFLSNTEVRSLVYGLKKIKQKKNTKTMVISNLAVNVHEVRMQDKTIRIASIENQFYRSAFIVWLIFNIKLFFTLNFSQYLQYFRKLKGEWNAELESPLRKFYLIIDKQWNCLLKDYSVALNDDIQVLKQLIWRVRRQYHSLWMSKAGEIQAKFSKN